jgi:hypothetical protein
VIALVYPSARVEELCAEARWVRVNGPYEAAAELLAGRAGALVADLGRVTAGHEGLLSLAARLAVPVVAFGEISADLGPEALGSARLVSKDRLGEALADVLRREPDGEAAPGGAEEAAEPEGPAPRPTQTLSQAELDALLG